METRIQISKKESIHRMSYYEKTIPLKYKIEDEVADASQITIKCTNADRKENKEECPVFTNGSPSELAILAFQTLIELDETYEWVATENMKPTVLTHGTGAQRRAFVEIKSNCEIPENLYP